MEYDTLVVLVKVFRATVSQNEYEVQSQGMQIMGTNIQL